jgi:hypothetical protein
MASNLNPEQLEALLNGPALKPPPGVVPQLDNPPAYRTASTALPVVCLVVATLGLAMRLYTRIRVLRQVNLADCECFSPTASSVVCTLYCTNPSRLRFHTCGLGTTHLHPLLALLGMSNLLTTTLGRLRCLLRHGHHGRQLWARGPSVGPPAPRPRPVPLCALSRPFPSQHYADAGVLPSTSTMAPFSTASASSSSSCPSFCSTCRSSCPCASPWPCGGPVCF